MVASYPAVHTEDLHPAVLTTVRDWPLRFLEQALDKSGESWRGGEHPLLGTTIAEAAARRKCKAFLEIGMQCCHTAAPVSHVMHENGGVYVGFENLEDVPASGGILDFFEEYASEWNPIIYRESFSAELAKPHGPYDMVLVDHFKELIPRDFADMVESGILAPGCWVFIHDAVTAGDRSWDPVVEYVQKNSLGTCTLLRGENSPVLMPDTGLVVIGDTQ